MDCLEGSLQLHARCSCVERIGQGSKQQTCSASEDAPDLAVLVSLALPRLHRLGGGAFRPRKKLVTELDLKQASGEDSRHSRWVRRLPWGCKAEGWKSRIEPGTTQGSGGALLYLTGQLKAWASEHAGSQGCPLQRAESLLCLHGRG